VHLPACRLTLIDRNIGDDGLEDMLAQAMKLGA
jgi:hypothetical protein